MKKPGRYRGPSLATHGTIMRLGQPSVVPLTIASLQHLSQCNYAVFTTPPSPEIWNMLSSRFLDGRPKPTLASVKRSAAGAPSGITVTNVPGRNSRTWLSMGTVKDDLSADEADLYLLTLRREYDFMVRALMREDT